MTEKKIKRTEDAEDCKNKDDEEETKVIAEEREDSKRIMDTDKNKKIERVTGG